MEYEWKCRHCHAITEVFRRSLGQRDVAPWHPCEGCGKADYERLTFGKVHLIGARSENQPWPMRLEHIEREEPVKDHKGNLVFDKNGVVKTHKVPIIAHSKTEYDEILTRRDLVMHQDGYDSTIGASQHSAWGQDKLEGPCPSENAQRMLDGHRYVERDELVSYGVSPSDL